MELIIEQLSKTYPNGVKALDRVCLQVPRGMYGLLGPNGAGKSTLMRTIATLQDADQGSIRLGDLDVLRDKPAVRRILGFLPQEFGVYPKVSAWQMLDHIAVLKGLAPRAARREAVEAMLERVNLYPQRHRALSGFSGGMKQRFGIAQALIGNPRLLIVDEPTAGLDPTERNRFYNLLSEVGEQVIVLLSTHIVQDVKELCPRMAIIHQGQVVFSGAPEQAEASLAGRLWRRQLTKGELEAGRADWQILSTKLVAGVPVIHVLGNESPGPEFQPIEPSLEDVFFCQVQGEAVSSK